MLERIDGLLTLGTRAKYLYVFRGLKTKVSFFFFCLIIVLCIFICKVKEVSFAKHGSYRFTAIFLKSQISARFAKKRPLHA